MRYSITSKTSKSILQIEFLIWLEPVSETEQNKKPHLSSETNLTVLDVKTPLT